MTHADARTAQQRQAARPRRTRERVGIGGRAVLTCGRCLVARSLARRMLAAAALALVFAVLACAPASAKMVLHGTIGPVSNPVGVAVDQSTHDVYVGGFGELDRFDASGQRLWSDFGVFSGDALAGGQVYAVQSQFNEGAEAWEQKLATFDQASGASQSSFPVAGSANYFGVITVVQIATDSAGNLYFPNAPNDAVQEFSPSGTLLNTFTGSGASALSAPTGVAVDAVGDVWVADDGNGRIEEFDPTGTTVLDTIAVPGVEAVALDDGGDVFASVHDGSGRHVLEFNSANTRIDDFGLGELGETETLDSVAVDDASKLVYVADGGNGVVRVYGPPLPIVTTGTAGNVEPTTATLAGHVDPDTADGGGEVTSCQFEYVEAAQYEPAAVNPYAAGGTASCTPSPPYGSAQDVTGSLTALKADTTYHFRLQATNENGTGYGADETFITPGPPAVDSESSSHARQSSALLEAKIDPFGYETECEVQYVQAAQYESSGYANAAMLPCPSSLAAGFADQSVSVPVSGLRVDTTYHYRFLATNQAGTTDGADRTFATFGIGSFRLQALDREGNPYTQAGGHPYALTTEIALNTTSMPIFKKQGSDENVKDIHTELPPGLIGNSSAVGRCTAAAVPIFQCPGDTQVGMVTAYTDIGTFEEPVYNLRPRGGDAAEFGARFSNAVTAYIDFHLRTGGDYGVNADTLNISTGANLFKIVLTVWGVPADPSHDPDRFCPSGDPHSGRRNCSAGAALRPFLTLPSSCAGEPTARVSVDSWQHPGEFVARSASMPALTGCDGPHFSPSLQVQPDTGATDSPSGLKVDLRMPQNENPAGVAEADLKHTVVTLPEGMAVDPSAANGLQACSLAQIELHGPEPARCPDASKIGTVEVKSPLLPDLQIPGIPDVLKGGVYVAEQTQNPFGSLLAIYVAAEDPASGVIVKLAGQIVADPITGRLTTTFAENPQLPFSDFKLDFFGGPRAALITPPTCGTYLTTSAMTPWSQSGDAHPSSPFTLAAGPGGSPCAATPGEEPNRPGFSAGTLNPRAGAYSPFVLHLRREDGSQRFSRIDTTLPPGLAARLAGVAECPDAAIQAAEAKSGRQEQQSPSCPAGSEVGTVNVAAGAGPDPYHTQGKAYLAGPYRGAPLSLAIVTPAVAGPYDLGDVVVRAALYVNPETAQVSVRSDPIPTILQGIPLDVRSINVRMDRPQFTLNPTNCEKMAVGGEALSVFDQASQLSTPFQVGNCESLGFSPRLALHLKGSPRRAHFPALTATLTMPAPGTRQKQCTTKHGHRHCRKVPVPQQANIARAQVTLPGSENLEQGHIRGTCGRPQLAAHSCPPDSVYGHATAVTPLLAQPISGPVYLVTGFGYRLPALVADLNGQIEVTLVGKVDTGRDHGIRNSFEVVPDAPVSKFTLHMFGGKRGLIVNEENLCAKHARRRALADFTAQNGRISDLEPTVRTSCKRSGRHRRHGSHDRAPKG